MLWLVCYDIVDDSQRQRRARQLEGWGQRVQYSVFECELSPTEQRHLRQLLQPYLDEKQDSLRWYPLCANCLRGTASLGKGIPPGEGREFHLV